MRAIGNNVIRSLALGVAAITLLFVTGLTLSVAPADAATLIKTGQCSVSGHNRCEVSFSPNVASPFPCFVKSTAISATPYQLHSTFVSDASSHDVGSAANTSQVQYTPSGVLCWNYINGHLGVDQFTNSSRLSTYKFELYSGTY